MSDGKGSLLPVLHVERYSKVFGFLRRPADREQLSCIQADVEIAAQSEYNCRPIERPNHFNGCSGEYNRFFCFFKRALPF
jgi:hypothetical protein